MKRMTAVNVCNAMIVVLTVSEERQCLRSGLDMDPPSWLEEFMDILKAGGGHGACTAVTRKLLNW